MTSSEFTNCLEILTSKFGRTSHSANSLTQIIHEWEEYSLSTTLVCAYNCPAVTQTGSSMLPQPSDLEGIDLDSCSVFEKLTVQIGLPSF